MFDQEFSKWLITLGVGGILAAFIFVFYRKDVKQYTELWRGATEMFMLIVKENTASSTKLISLIETWERNALRKEDISLIVEKKIEKEK